MAATLDYWRADNMWAAIGRPDGNLGQESVTVNNGETRVFVTDWRYEKKRNDGSNFYGSHARRVRNASTTESIIVRLNGGPLLGALRLLVAGSYLYEVTLPPGQEQLLQHDIMEVRSTVPKAPAVVRPPAPLPKPSTRPKPPPGRPRVDLDPV